MMQIGEHLSVQLQPPPASLVGASRHVGVDSTDLAASDSDYEIESNTF